LGGMAKVEPINDSFDTEETEVENEERINAGETKREDEEESGAGRGGEDEESRRSHSPTPSLQSSPSPTPPPHPPRRLPQIEVYHVKTVELDMEEEDMVDRHRKPETEEMSGGARCCFGLLTLVAQVLLHGVVALTLYWVIQYRWQDKKGFPFAWRGSEPGDREKQWNLHPVLMITGLIYCAGQAMLVYRSCRCCRRIWNKLLHTMFHLLALPCVVLGFMAAFDYHQERKDKDGAANPIPHFYSVHSWLGLATMAVYAIQFVVGVFSFLLLLCCESATAGFRAALVPLHSTFGTSTFLLAIGTAVAGLTEKAFFELRSELVEDASVTAIAEDPLENLGEEAIFRNTIGAILAALGLLIPAMLTCDSFRRGLPREGLQDARI